MDSGHLVATAMVGSRRASSFPVNLELGSPGRDPISSSAKSAYRVSKMIIEVPPGPGHVICSELDGRAGQVPRELRLARQRASHEE